MPERIECLECHQRKLKSISRFWSKVNKQNSCWKWTASFYPNGYGQVKFNGKVRGSHRVAWELTNGPIPTGMVVCHRCDNRWCVNPLHLFLGTVQDNIDDKVSKGRHVYGEKHPLAKLTNALVAEIRKAHPSNLNNQQTADKYGVSRRSISMILRGDTWKKVKTEDVNA